jgi:tRNA-dihydrouridine synthase A
LAYGSAVTAPADPLKAHRRLSVAPMMDWTDRHCRVLHRTLSSKALLYTEMVTTGALLHGDVPRHLRFNEQAFLNARTLQFKVPTSA